jgi:hypothetical protein
MSDTGQIILLVGALIIVYILTRKVHAWQIGRAYKVIIQDLENAGARAPASAVTLPYAKVKIFRVGMRDYRPKALQFLVAGNIVGMTESEQYYLIDRGPLRELS